MPELVAAKTMVGDEAPTTYEAILTHFQRQAIPTESSVCEQQLSESEQKVLQKTT